MMTQDEIAGPAEGAGGNVRRTDNQNNREKMKTKINHSEAVERIVIDNLAWQIWEEEGRQMGRDQEYWFRAERQLLEVGRQESKRTNGANGHRKTSPARARQLAGV